MSLAPMTPGKRRRRGKRARDRVIGILVRLGEATVSTIARELDLEAWERDQDEARRSVVAHLSVLKDQGKVARRTKGGAYLWRSIDTAPAGEAVS